MIEDKTRLADWQVRVVEERDVLEEKLQEHVAFIGTGPFNELAPEDRNLLLQQKEAMTWYSDVLKLRIGRFVPEKSA